MICGHDASNKAANQTDLEWLVKCRRFLVLLETRAFCKQLLLDRNSKMLFAWHFSCLASNFLAVFIKFYNKLEALQKQIRRDQNATAFALFGKFNGRSARAAYTQNAPANVLCT